MKHQDEIKKITYEYCCEYVDEYGDILDTDFADKLSDIYPSRFIKGYTNKRQFCIVRTVGSEAEGITDRSWAYVGEREFCSGQKVPAGKFNQLLKTQTSEVTQ